MADEGPRGTYARHPGNQVGLRSAAVDGREVVALRCRYRLLFGPGDQVWLDAGANASRRVAAPIVPPPSRGGTGVFIPNYVSYNIVRGGHGGARDGNTPRGDGAFVPGAYVGDYPDSHEAFPNVGATLHHTHFGFGFSAIGKSELEPEIDEEEAAQLIGIDLYNQINSNT